MATVILAQPAVERRVETLLPRFVEERSGVYPPLGLACLAASLRAHGVTTGIVDGAAEELGVAALAERVLAARPDCVGLGATSFTLPDMLETAASLKRRNPDLPVLLGGIHATLYPGESSRLPGVDWVLAGEADESVLLFADMLEGRRRPAEVPGLWRDGRRLGPPPRPVRDLGALPLPARDLLPMERYRSIHGPDALMSTMITGRGCAHACRFCHRAFGRGVRRRPMDGVLAEFEDLASRGVKDVFLFDDCFTAHRPWVLALCDELAHRRLPLVFDVRTRVDQVDDAILDGLVRAGCARISFGIESATPRVLAALGKGCTVEQARRAVRAAKARGLEVYGDFVFGARDETPGEMLATLRFSLELGLDWAQYAALTPYPGTELYAELLAEGRMDDVWAVQARRPRSDFVVPLCCDAVPDDALRAFVRHAYRRFYMRPSFVLGRLVRGVSARRLREWTAAAFSMAGASR